MSFLENLAMVKELSIATMNTDFQLEPLVDLMDAPKEEVEMQPLQVEATPPHRESPIDLMTRTEIAQTFVDQIFDTYTLPSLNSSFFGAFVSGVTPFGYALQNLGEHTFLVKANQITRLSAVITLLEQINSVLETQESVTVPLCIKQNIEGAIGYSLVLSLEELHQLQRCRPEYKLGFTGLHSLDTLGLTVIK